MTRVDQLAKHIERTITGPQWHGPVLDYVLTGVTAEQAAAHPIGGAHSIWELVLHIAAWAEIARARLDGRATADPPPDVDWPPVTGTTPQDWDAALHRMRESHRNLAARVRQMSEPALDEKLHGLDYTSWYLLHGVVEHSAYHGGQIMMLRKGSS